ncbi:MAG: chorismate lyase [Mariprofundales bacterium]|nr:chorismate lyase [Mariprofundales bacterium]
MFFGDMESQEWTHVRQWHGDVARPVVAVLTATGSLTRFVDRHFGLLLTVRLHDQFVDKATDIEAALLGCDPALPVLRRQVSLLSGSRIMFDAESVLPLDGVPAELMVQLESGELPLGNLLIDRGVSLSRSDLSIARFIQQSGEANWARRSVLRSGSGTRALVVELFHDLFWHRIGGDGC